MFDDVIAIFFFLEIVGTSSCDVALQVFGSELYSPLSLFDLVKEKRCCCSFNRLVLYSLFSTKGADECSLNRLYVSDSFYLPVLIQRLQEEFMYISTYSFITDVARLTSLLQL